MKKELSILTAVIFLLAGVISSVSAFGIATPYWRENPLLMQPGESKDVQFTLQNMVGDDVTIRVALLDGSNVATLTDYTTDYLVKKGTANTKVNMHISIPADSAGAKHTITMSFSTVTSGASGGVKIGTSIEKSFDVLVEKEAKAGAETWMWIVAALALLAIIILLLKPKKAVQAVQARRARPRRKPARKRR
jgi:hypothetical protein